MEYKELTEIAKRLKKLRNDKELSLQELSDRTGLTKSTLQRYETGNIGNIPLSKIDILAKGLGVSPHTILGWDETIGAPASELTEDDELMEYLEELKNNPGMRTLFSKTKNATKEDIEKVIKMIDIMKGDFDGGYYY